MKGFFKYGCPTINLIINQNKIEALLDTGFNGDLMLPQKIIDKLNLEEIGFSDFTTASGETKKTKVYKSAVKLFDREIETSVLSTDSDFSLAGMELFHNCKIIIERSKNILEINC